MKIHGPLQSTEASGTIADVLTFSKRRTGQQARFQKKQDDVLTAPRVTQRGKFFNASLACRFMDYGVSFYGAAIYGAEKNIFDFDAKTEPLTGYNLCIKEFLDMQ